MSRRARIDSHAYLAAAPAYSVRPGEPIAVAAEGLAAMLGVSRSLVWKLDTKGEIPVGFRLGERRLWSVEEIRAWVAAGAPPRDRWEWPIR